MSTKSKATTRSAMLAEGESAALLATNERADMMATRPSGYPRDLWVFLFEGITIPIAFIPKPPTV